MDTHCPESVTTPCGRSKSQRPTPFAIGTASTSLPTLRKAGSHLDEFGMATETPRTAINPSEMVCTARCATGRVQDIPSTRTETAGLLEELMAIAILALETMICASNPCKPLGMVWFATGLVTSTPFSRSKHKISWASKPREAIMVSLTSRVAITRSPCRIQLRCAIGLGEVTRNSPYNLDFHLAPSTEALRPVLSADWDLAHSGALGSEISLSRKSRVLF